jgi:hypothetical protein
MYAIAKRLDASHLDRGQAVGQHCGEDLDHWRRRRRFSLRRTRSRPAGSGQSLNGALFLSAPGFLAGTGT